MKKMAKNILVLLVAFGCISSVAKAEFYERYFSSWSDCYINQNDIDFSWTNRYAIDNACENAKNACYADFSRRYPSAQFECKPVIRNIIYSTYATFVMRGDIIANCSYSDQALYFAQARCMVEVFRE